MKPKETTTAEMIMMTNF